MSEKHLEILGYFVEFVQGGGPSSGQWYVFLKWMNEMGYKDGEVEQATTALGKEIGRDL